MASTGSQFEDHVVHGLGMGKQITSLFSGQARECTVSSFCLSSLEHTRILTINTDLTVLEKPRIEDYDIKYWHGNSFSFLGNGFATRELDGVSLLSDTSYFTLRPYKSFCGLFNILKSISKLSMF